jgi:predicted transposase YdaD
MSNGGTVAEHDSGYKSLFSHPEMVEDLLRGFVHEDWVRDLDFSTLEKVPGNYVAPNLMPRESDIVWKLRWKGDRVLYVYLLMEFQSTVDSSMALRMMVYLGLLYQDLLKRGETTPSGKLPPVLPLVLYNGYAPWGAVREISELIEEVPGGLERYRPQLRFPELLDLEEVKAMLAESGFSWSDRWEQEGFEKGRGEGRETTLAEARGVLLQDLESRFGPLPEEVRRRVEAITSIEELTRFTLRAGAASSLDALVNR